MPMLIRIESDDANAARVEAALNALHAGRDFAEADAYLRSVREVPERALRVACSLLADPEKVSPPALHFAASSLEEHACRAPCQTAAIAKHALSHPVCGQEMSIAGRLCAAAVRQIIGSALESPLRGSEFGENSRIVQCSFAQLIGELRHAAAASAPGNECLADEAVAHASNLQTLLDPRSHALLYNLCSAEAVQVQQRSAQFLVTNSIPLKQKRIAISCMRAWIPYTHDLIPAVLEPLVQALATAPELANDIAFAAGETIEALGTRSNISFQPVMLRSLVFALRRLYDSATNSDHTDDYEEVFHAIAEICVSIADTVADSLVERNADDREAAGTTSEIISLMLLCTQSQSHRTFEAALSSWDTWIASASVVSGSNAHVVISALPAVVCAIVSHLFAARTAADEAILGGDDDEQMSARLRNSAVDTLHQAAQILSVAEYVKILEGSLQNEAALFALAAAGDVACSETDSRAVANLIPQIIALTHENGIRHPQAIRRSAVRVMAAFAHVLVSPAVSDNVLSTALTTACGLLGELGMEPASFLQEAAEADARRLLPFLPLLIDCAEQAFGASALLMLRSSQQDSGAAQDSQLSAPEMVVFALAQIAAELPSHSVRNNALRRIIKQPLETLHNVKSEARVVSLLPSIDWQQKKDVDTYSQDLSSATSRDLRLIGVAMRGINDSSVSTGVMETLYDVLTNLCRRYSADSGVAAAVCQVFEASAGPTFTDPGEQRSCPADVMISADARCRLILSCISLAAGGFLASGPTGESCWLSTIATLAAHVVPMRVSELSPVIDTCLVHAMQRAQRGLFQFTEGVGLESRPDMLRAILRYFDVILTGNVTMNVSSPLLDNNVPDVTNALLHSAAGCGHIGLFALSVNDPTILHPALTWWSNLLSKDSARQFAEQVVGHAGGERVICDRFIVAACGRSAPRKVIYLAADALMNMRHWTGGQLDFTLDGAEIPEPERNMVQQALQVSVNHGNSRLVRACLADVARVVQREIGVTSLMIYTRKGT